MKDELLLMSYVLTCIACGFFVHKSSNDIGLSVLSSILMFVIFANLTAAICGGSRCFG